MRLRKIKPYYATPVFCLFVFILITLSSLFSISYDGSVYSVLAVCVLQIAVFVLPGVIFCRLVGIVSPKDLGFKRFRVQNIALVLCSAVFLFSASVLFGLVLEPDYAQNHVVADLTALSAQSVIYITVVYCILPAVTEEFVFRSVIYGQYRKYGVFCAAAVSSVLFALMHFSLTELPKFLLCGAVLALVYEVTHSVIASISVHLIFNLLTVFSQKLLTDAAGKAENTLPFVFLFVSVLLLFLFLSLSRAQSQLEYDSINIPPESPDKERSLQYRMRSLLLSFLSPTFLACAVYAVVFAVIRLKSST